MVTINDLSFNPDYSSISVSTSDGFKIFNCEPFGEFYSQDTPARFPTAFLKMLFSTSLTIVVPQTQDNLGNRLLKIYNLKQNLKICELNFPSSIIDIKLNRKRLLVVLDTGQLYIYDLSCVRLLKILQLSFNEHDGDQKFIGDLSADDSSWLIIPVQSTNNQTDLLNAETGSQPSTPKLTPSDSDIKKDSEGWVVVYDTINLAPVVIFEAHHSTIARICISHRDNKVATASIKGTIIRIFDLKEFEGKVKVHKVKNLRRGHNLVKVNSLSFHNDNHILGCGSESNTIHLFKIHEEESDICTNENSEDRTNHNSDYEDSDGDTSKSSEDLNENLANLLISKPLDPVPMETEDKLSSSWFVKTKKLINNQYTSSIIKKLPYKDYFENLIWEPPQRSFAYIKLPEYAPHNEKDPRSNKVEIGFNNDLVFIASYHTGNFYQYQIPKQRGSCHQ
ncbi:WD domain, G-beta repeat family protein [Candida albicans]|uniref:WD domain, G-beta repeat family protein n=1 Tax=Candida albicans TaxID=5476 RepID=A0A8H6C1Y5_CANAX|nr:WD domain, G-beta repeat family protein [Candida albicans]